MGALSVVICAILSSIFLKEKLTLFGRVRVGDAGGRGGDGGGGCERGADGADGDSEGGVGEERQESFEGDVPGLPESGSVKEVVVDVAEKALESKDKSDSVSVSVSLSESSESPSGSRSRSEHVSPAW